MGNLGVDSIELVPLKRISVVGGDVLHALKSGDKSFIDFGEAYFSLVEPGFVKGWKRHMKMTMNLVVPIGGVNFVFFDDSGQVREESIGESSYSRLVVPPRVWFGFRGCSYPINLLLNIADIPHDPREVERLEINEFNYKWDSV